jgi:hypothetical protein
MSVPWGFVTGLFSAIFPALSTLFGVLSGLLASGVVALYVIYSNILDEEIDDFTVTLAAREASAISTNAAAAVPSPQAGS